MGHVTALGRKLGELGQQRAAVAHALAASQAWAAWQRQVLLPRSETENLSRRAASLPAHRRPFCSALRGSAHAASSVPASQVQSHTRDVGVQAQRP
jgi:hypothetical protein